ncbi:MAG: HslU--HslV peptidase ATPase subunit, partial [Candidatus Atribacteria bacterium]|nr:HslU--HslV peptidase ATPase subunit [Candidatus Atribacteria bacterium]
TEGVKVKFEDEAIDEIANIAFLVNEQTENIGARRIYTILEKILEEISFNAPEIKKKNIIIDRAYVVEKMKDIVKSEDISRYIL